MSFRRRVTLLAGAAVAIAIVVSSVAAYLAVRGQLRGQVDRSLRQRAAQFEQIQARVEPRPPGPLIRPRPQGGGPPYGTPRRPPQRPGELDAYEQLLAPSGAVLAFPGGDALPIGEEARAVAAGDSTATTIVDTERDGRRIRLLVAPLAGGGAIQLGRSLQEVDDTLGRLRLILVAIAAAGIALAALLGRIVTGRAIGPLRRLTESAEHVTQTRDLGHRIDGGETASQDEIGRLTVAFNRMLDAVEGSVVAQRQLIADASHELRTPVTSLRTNLDILEANPDLEPARRVALLQTARTQAEELTVLMNDVIDLARGDQREEDVEELRLDELVEEAIERAARHAPDTLWTVALEETTVRAAADRLGKAVNNLLDNAIKWNARGEPVEVSLRGGVLVVRDHGPGFEPDEVAHVFDRFFRGSQSRGRSGSGLGLAIVRQAAEAHGGTVEAANATGGGAALTLRLPLAGASPTR